MLNIRDKSVHAMARELAARRGTSMTNVIAEALRRELAEEVARPPLAEQLLNIGKASAAKAKSRARDVTRDEIDAMWTR